MLYKRRLILQHLLNITAFSGVLAALPGSVFARWSEAFNARTVDDALLGLYESSDFAESENITLKVPEIAENGAVVPVTVKTDIADISRISIFAEKNPQPLAASFVIPEGTVADVSVRIRLGETMNVRAVAEANGKLYSVNKEVKVTIGGCGG